MIKMIFLAHCPGLTPRSVQEHGLGLRVEVSIPKYVAQYLQQNRSAWFVTYDLDEKKYPMYLAQYLCRNTITKVPGLGPTTKKLVGTMVQDLVQKKKKKRRKKGKRQKKRTT